MVTGSEGIDMRFKLSRLVQSLCSILLCFLKFNEHQNHLEGLLGPKFHIQSFCLGLWWGQRVCVSSRLLRIKVWVSITALNHPETSEGTRDHRKEYIPIHQSCVDSVHLCKMHTLVITVSSTKAATDKGRTHLTNIKWVSCRVKCFLDPCGLTQLKFLCSCILKTSVCISKQLTEKVGQPGMGADSWDGFVTGGREVVVSFSHQWDVI